MDTAVNIAQIIVALGVITIVLLGSRGTGVGSAFGGDSGSIYHTRRGIERTVFNMTIGIIVIFVVLAILSTLVN